MHRGGLPLAFMEFESRRQCKSWAANDGGEPGNTLGKAGGWDTEPGSPKYFTESTAFESNLNCL